MVATLALAGCSPGTSTDVGNSSGRSNAPTVSDAPAAPAHGWSYQEGQEYGYTAAISEDDQRAGTAAAPVQMFRYLGEKDGVYTVQLASNGSTMTASCANPCQVVKIREGGETERLAFNPQSLAGAALTDAFNGQLEVYGSSAADAAHAQTPASRASAGAPASAPPVVTTEPSSDPYAADRTAEREADASKDQDQTNAPR